MLKKRGFLNPRAGTAAYEYIIDEDGGELKLTDCFRAVTLEFFFGSQKRARKKKALEKADRMIKMLQEFRKALENQKVTQDDE